MLEKLGGIIGLRSRVGKAYSVQCTIKRAPQFIKAALVFLSLWREPWSNSVWGMENFARLPLCFTPLVDVVLILQQGGPNCPTRWS